MQYTLDAKMNIENKIVCIINQRTRTGGRESGHRKGYERTRLTIRAAVDLGNRLQRWLWVLAWNRCSCLCFGNLWHRLLVALVTVPNTIAEINE